MWESCCSIIYANLYREVLFNMKEWQKSFLGGLVIGGLGIIPLLLWLAEIRLTFRCPSCGERITVWKEKKQLVPQLQSDSQKQGDGPSEDSEERTDLAIATAPTI